MITEKQKYKGRAIVMYGRSLMALEIAHSLGQRGIEVIGCDDVDFTVLSFSRFVKKTFTHAAHNKKPERFIEDLEKNIIKHKPVDDRPYVLIPVFRETDLVAAHAERLSKHIRIAAPCYESISKVHPKDKLARTALELGTRVPETWLPRSESDLEDIPLPALIKPTNEVGGHGIRTVKDKTALLEAYRHNYKIYKGPPLVQQIVTGRDYCLAVLCEEGEIKASMAYRNIRKFPSESGAGIIRETVDDTMFAEIARPLLREIQWNGVAEIDFIWDEDPASSPWLIEINARFWAGLFQSIQSGIDFPWLLYELISTGHISSTDPAKIGQKTKVPTMWLFSAIQEILNSEQKRESMEVSWDKALTQVKDRDVREHMRHLEMALRRKMSPREAVQAFKKVMAEIKGAKSEMPLKEDPFVIFGVMFILSSMIRHGKLPPEITNSHHE